MSPYNTKSLGQSAYVHTKWHLNPSSRLAATDMGRKLGAVPFRGWGAGSPSNTLSPRLRPTSVPSGILIHPAVWPQYTWAENRGLCPPFLGSGGSPSSKMWPGPKPTSMPSTILIHPAVWRQGTWVENWGRCLLGKGELGPHLTQCGRGRGLHACQVSS